MKVNADIFPFPSPCGFSPKLLELQSAASHMCLFLLVPAADLCSWHSASHARPAHSPLVIYDTHCTPISSCPELSCICSCYLSCPIGLCYSSCLPSLSLKWSLPQQNIPLGMRGSAQSVNAHSWMWLRSLLWRPCSQVRRTGICAGLKRCSDTGRC